MDYDLLFSKINKICSVLCGDVFYFCAYSYLIVQIVPQKSRGKGEALAEKENFHSKRSQEEVEHCGKKTEFHHGHAALLIALLCSQPICFHASKRKLPLNVYF